MKYYLTTLMVLGLLVTSAAEAQERRTDQPNTRLRIENSEVSERRAQQQDLQAKFKREGQEINNNGLVPDCGYDIKTQSNPNGLGRACGLTDVITLIQRLIEYIFFLVLPIAAIVFAYAGFLYMTSGSNKDKRSRAKNAMTKLVIGIIVIMSAWFIVKIILDTLGVDTTIADQFLDLDS